MTIKKKKTNKPQTEDQSSINKYKYNEEKEYNIDSTVRYR